MLNPTVAPGPDGVVHVKRAYWYEVYLVDNGALEAETTVVAYNRDEAKRAAAKDRGWPMRRIRARRARKGDRLLQAVTA